MYVATDSIHTPELRCSYVRFSTVVVNCTLNSAITAFTPSGLHRQRSGRIAQTTRPRSEGRIRPAPKRGQTRRGAGRKGASAAVPPQAAAGEVPVLSTTLVTLATLEVTADPKRAAHGAFTEPVP